MQLEMMAMSVKNYAKILDPLTPLKLRGGTSQMSE